MSLPTEQLPVSRNVVPPLGLSLPNLAPDDVWTVLAGRLRLGLVFGLIWLVLGCALYLVRASQPSKQLRVQSKSPTTLLASNPCTSPWNPEGPESKYLRSFWIFLGLDAY